MKLPRLVLNIPNVINVIGAVVIVYLGVVLAETVKRNYDLGNQIAQLRAETNLLTAQRDQLSYDITYYGTDSYRDREARSKLGLQRPGENVVIIPHASPNPGANSAATQPRAQAPSHFSDWLNFLLGREQ